jgi:hypothetical protein
MRRSCYTIEKYERKRDEGKWVIVACDAPVLICHRKSTATAIARQAASLLRLDEFEIRKRLSTLNLRKAA